MRYTITELYNNKKSFLNFFETAPFLTVQKFFMFFKISPLPDKLSFRLNIIYQIISDNLKKEIPLFKYIIIVKEYQLVNGYSLNMP